MSNPSAVVFISGSSAADVLAGLGRAFRESFERLGHVFIEINFAKPGAGELLNKTISERPIELAFGFIGAGMELTGATPEGQSVNLWEGLGVPYVSMYGDSPAYFFDRHVMPGNRFACLYGFPEHRALRKRLPYVRGLLGGIPPIVLDPMSTDDIDFSVKERGKILFLKNGNDPQALIDTWRRQLSNSLFGMLTDLAGDLLAKMNDPLGVDIDRAVAKYFLDRDLELDSLVALRLFFVAQLDDYLRRVKSTLIVESLLDFPVEVHGDKWGHVDFRARRATLVSGGDYGRSKSLILNSLAILDMSPNTAAAPHDRPLRAMGMHTLFLTNDQRYFMDRFSDYQTFSFSFTKESIQSKVADVIAHPKRYVDLGRGIAEAFRTSMDRDALARFLIDVASCLRLGSASRPQGLQDYFAWPPEKLK